MRNLSVVAGSIALTLVCWGLFGPLLQQGVAAMHYSALPPLICLGSAYFLLAVGVPIFWLRTREEEGGWSTAGVLWALLAGTAAALGAVGVVLALKFRGHPLTVVPVVVGLIPIVHALLTMWTGGTLRRINWLFYGAVILVGVGVVGVLAFQPRPQNVDIDGPLEDGSITVSLADRKLTWTADNLQDLSTNPTLTEAYRWYQLKKRLSITEFIYVTLSVLLAAICWGSYATLSRNSRLAMEGSRLRPVLVVGLAFLVLAVIVPIVWLVASPAGGWSVLGVLWSVLAGAAGVGGVLGLIGALNCGGKTTHVLPVAFGGTLIVSTAAAMFQQGTLGGDWTWFAGSLLLILIGAMAAPMFSPKADEDEDAEKPRRPADVDRKKPTDRERPRKEEPQPASEES